MTFLQSNFRGVLSTDFVFSWFYDVRFDLCVFSLRPEWWVGAVHPLTARKASLPRWQHMLFLQRLQSWWEPEVINAEILSPPTQDCTTSCTPPPFPAWWPSTTQGLNLCHRCHPSLSLTLVFLVFIAKAGGTGTVTAGGRRQENIQSLMSIVLWTLWKIRTGGGVL